VRRTLPWATAHIAGVEQWLRQAADYDKADHASP
jgi:hypothetical protein